MILCLSISIRTTGSANAPLVKIEVTAPSGLPMSNPPSLRPVRNTSMFSQSCFRRSGIACINSSVLIVAAVIGLGNAFVSTKLGELNLTKSKTFCGPHRYPPKVPNDFANVPPCKSISSSTPNSSGVPRPFSPITPVP